MNSVEGLFLELGIGYTNSKLLAYLIFPILGIVVWLLVRKRFKTKWKRAGSLILAVVLPFGIYFAFYPIYEGDFSNSSVMVSEKSELDDLEPPKLVVISIPNCPFCYGSVSRMLDLKKRHPDIQIEYRVCVSDTLADRALKVYQKLSKGKLKIQVAENGKELANVAEMTFPTFVLVRSDKKIKWHNDDFGAGALDEVAAAFEK
jgi:hypothetical protein